MTQPPYPADAERRDAIARLLADIRAARLADKQVDDATICEFHQHLMPELGAELEKLRRIHAARRAAATPPPPPPPSTPTAAEDLHIPTALINDLESPTLQIPGYSLLREISRGGQAAVYLATQLSTGRKIAIKLMHDGPFASDRAITRFRREVQALAALNHPNIVTIIDTGKTPDGTRFIAMNYIPGMNLSDFMKDRHKKDPTDPSKLLRLFHKICDAVNAAHRLGIIHRDLKPSNIRVDERGEPHILDFGLARTALDHALGTPDHAVSITGEFLGSLPWSSPEQAEGNPEKIDIRSDVYSLGVILYQILTAGRFPYDVVGNMRDVLNNILTAAPFPPSKMARMLQPPKIDGPAQKPTLPEVSETMERIVLKALAKNPSERYQSAGELGRDIARYLAGQRTAARESERPEPAATPAKFPQKLALSIAAVILLALAVALYFFRPARQLPINPSAATSVSQPSHALNPPTTPPATAPSFVADAPWLELFNGKDLTCWQKQNNLAANWRIEDGILIGNLTSHPWAALVATKTLSKNFRCRVETVMSEGASSAQMFFAPQSGEKFSVVIGGTIPRNNWKTGDIRASAKMLAVSLPSKIEPGEWFTQEVSVEDGHIVVFVNGQKVAECVREGEGPHEFQLGILCSPDSQVRLRHIDIQELPDNSAFITPRAASLTANFPMTFELAQKNQRDYAADTRLPATRSLNIDAATPVQFALIPPGHFLTGSPEKHDITISHAFYLATTPITVAQFTAFIKQSHFQTRAEKTGAAFTVINGSWQSTANASWRNPGFEQSPNDPVVEIAWPDAVAFCNWLSKTTGQHLRLPTSAEWEYACRAGSSTQFYVGDTWPELEKAAWYRRNSMGKTHPVAQKIPNPWGLYDMHGNASQWCQDWFSDAPIADAVDPTGPNVGEDRVKRGGSWFENFSTSGSSAVRHNPPNTADSVHGFRVLLEVP